MQIRKLLPVQWSRSNGSLEPRGVMPERTQDVSSNHHIPQVSDEARAALAIGSRPWGLTAQPLGHLRCAWITFAWTSTWRSVRYSTDEACYQKGRSLVKLTTQEHTHNMGWSQRDWIDNLRHRASSWFYKIVDSTHLLGQVAREPCQWLHNPKTHLVAQKQMGWFSSLTTWREYRFSRYNNEALRSSMSMY